MSQIPLFGAPIWTVADITRYLHDLLDGDDVLQDLWVTGEVSNVSRPSSGHLYFTIKDRNASLRCVMWRNALLRQVFTPRDGDAIEAHGNISIYDAGGAYQLYADLVRPVGEGLLYQEFLRFKARLEAEGLFDAGRKRPLPTWVRRIGVVTSPTGAAFRDILNTLRRRYPLVEVILSAAPVQGDNAPPSITAALERLNRLAQPDVILLVRGGGSMEDLWAFNDERVARAIAASQAPVISGVGHETDFTIADFVADVRAPTPTAAAELASPDQAELRQTLDDARLHISRYFQTYLDLQRQSVRSLENALRRSSPLAMIRLERQRVDEHQRRVVVGLEHQLRTHQLKLEGLTQRLEALNPRAILERGYAIVRGQDGSLVRSVRQVQHDERLNVQVSDGQFPVVVDPF